MTTGLKAILLALAAITCEAPAWAAIDAVSELYGGTSTVLPGTGSSASPLALFSLRLVRPEVAAGAVSVVSGSTLTDENAGWADNQFNGGNGAFYVEFDSGLMADVVSTSASTKTLTVAGNIEGGVLVGDRYRVRQHATIGSVFGLNNEAGLLGGINPNVADNVILQMAQTQQTLTYFYSTISGLGGWRTTAYTPAASTIIFPEQGIMVRRRGMADLVLHATGQVKTSPTVAPIWPGHNLLGTVQSVGSVKLSDLNLHTGDPNTGVAAGINPVASDSLMIVSPAGATTTYFYCSLAGLPGWRTTGYAAAGDIMIPAGSAFFIQRKAPHGPFDWTIPAE